MLRGRDLVLGLRNPKTFTCIFRFRIITTAAGSAKKEGSGYPLSQLSPELSLFFVGYVFLLFSFLFFFSCIDRIRLFIYQFTDVDAVGSRGMAPACKENLDGEKVVPLFPSWLWDIKVESSALAWAHATWAQATGAGLTDKCFHF